MFAAFDNAPTLPATKVSIAEKKEKVPNDEYNTLLTEAQEKVKQTIIVFQNIKFKSLAILTEWDNYAALLKKLERKGTKFTKEELTDITKKANNIIKSYSPKPEKEEKSQDVTIPTKNARHKQSEENTGEYKVQSTPDISKKVLKYQFVKNDTVVDTALQNSLNITPKQVKAFADTNYDGELNNYQEHQQYANYYKGKYIHDFYYAEGDIYEKLERLTIDFAGKLDDEEVKSQYNKQKALLESV